MTARLHRARRVTLAGMSIAAALAAAALAADGCALIAGVQDGVLAPDGGSGGVHAASSATGTVSTTGSGGGSGASTSSSASVTSSASASASTGASSVAASSSSAAASSSAAVSSSAAASSSSSSGSGDGGVVSKYAAQVLADTPLGYWRLGEQAPPKAYDISGNGYTGDYLNAVTLGAPGAIAGDPDTAITLTGAGQEVNIGSVLDFPNDQAFSIEVWVNPAVAGEGAIVCKSVQLSGVYEGYQLVLQPSTNPVLYRGSATAEDVVQGTPIAVGKYSHVVVTFDTLNMLVYVNAALVASTVAVPVPEVAAPVALTFGDQVAWANFQGSLDEIAIYDHALSPARISAHYTAGTTP